MRLSNITNNYQDTGGIVDRQQITVTDGTLRIYPLTYVPGSEEVYVNGDRKSSGSDKHYTTVEGGGHIAFTYDLNTSDEIILVGRSTVNEIPYTRAVSESIILNDGQTDVILVSVETLGAELFVSGSGIDSKRLISVQDYNILSTKNISLTSSYPAGTLLEVVQSARLAWVDPNNLMVNANGYIRSLSSRFDGIQSSYDYYVEKNGRQIASLFVGYVLRRWKMNDNTGVITTNPEGEYATLVVSGSAWIPRVSISGVWVVNTWEVDGDELRITVREQTTLEVQELLYVRADGGGGSGGGLQWNMAPEGVFNGLEGFGYLIKGGTTCNLPVTPSGSLTIGFKDPDGSWMNIAALINPNGATIEGSTEPFNLNVAKASVELVYIEGDWKIVELGAGGTGPTEIREDSFGSGTTFSMSAIPANEASLLVIVDGVMRTTSGYSVSGSTLTLSPAASTSCSVRHLGSPTPMASLQSASTNYDDSSNNIGSNVSDALDSLYRSSGRKNLIINGGFNIWTRGTSFPNGSSRYTADRWFIGTGSMIDRVLAPVSVSPYIRNPYGVRLHTTSGRRLLEQGVELDVIGEAGQFAVGKTYTLSFEMYSDAAQGIESKVSFRDAVGSATNEVVITTPLMVSTIVGRNRYSVSFTIDAVPAATNTCLSLSMYSTSTSTSVDWIFFDVQLEEGLHSTSFEYRTTTEEQDACGRYYQEISDTVVLRTNDTLSSASFYGGVSNLVFPVGMRDVPTVELISLGGTSASTPNISNTTNKSTVLYPKEAWVLGDWDLTTVILDSEL